MSLDALSLDRLVERLADAVTARLRADSEKLVDRAELAARLSVSPRTIATMVSKGQLPPPLLCTGGVSRPSWASVVSYLESRSTRRSCRSRFKRSEMAPRNQYPAKVGGSAIA
jgi:hypothetical protein